MIESTWRPLISYVWLSNRPVDDSLFGPSEGGDFEIVGASPDESRLRHSDTDRLTAERLEVRLSRARGHWIGFLAPRARPHLPAVQVAVRSAPDSIDAIRFRHRRGWDSLGFLRRTGGILLPEPLPVATRTAESLIAGRQPAHSPRPERSLFRARALEHMRREAGWLLQEPAPLHAMETHFVLSGHHWALTSKTGTRFVRTEHPPLPPASTVERALAATRVAHELADRWAKIAGSLPHD